LCYLCGFTDQPIQASRFIPAPGVAEADLANAAQLSSLADETPEGRSIVVLAKEQFGLRGREFRSHEAQFVLASNLFLMWNS
jgi:K+-transporting ATPase ATPase B chain